MRIRSVITAAWLSLGAACVEEPADTAASTAPITAAELAGDDEAPAPDVPPPTPGHGGPQHPGGAPAPSPSPYPRDKVPIAPSCFGGDCHGDALPIPQLPPGRRCQDCHTFPDYHGPEGPPPGVPRPLPPGDTPGTCGACHPIVPGAPPVPPWWPPAPPPPPPADTARSAPAS